MVKPLAECKRRFRKIFSSTTFRGAFLLALVVFSIVSPVLGASKADAWYHATNMYEAYPATNEMQGKQGTTTTGNVYNLVPVDEYQVAKQHLKLSIAQKTDGGDAINSNAAKYSLFIDAHSGDGVDTVYGLALDNGKLIAVNGGRLDAIYRDADFQDNLAASGGDNYGAWLEVTDKINTSYQPWADQYFVEANTTSYSIAQILHNLPQEEAAKIAQKESFTVEPVLSGLTANTQYYARIRIAEDQESLGEGTSGGDMGTNGRSFGSSFTVINPIISGTIGNIVPGTHAGNNAYSNVVPFMTPANDTSNLGTTTLQTGAFDSNAALESAFHCSATSPTTWFYGCIAYAYYKVVYWISAWLVSIAAGVFDAFAAISISSIIYRAPTFILGGWQTVRDISNIFFIFILLFISIGIILNLHSVKAKDMIIKVIVIALLVNFSLFFTKIIIDASNSLAHVFVNEIVITDTSTDQDVVNSDGTGIGKPVHFTTAIADGFLLSKMFSEKTMTALTDSDGYIDTSTLFLIVTLGIILNLVAMWVFLSTALFFVGRILGFWFAMIFAPLAFVSSIVPGIDKGLKQLGWSQWLENLMSLAIMAPIYFFFLFLIIQFLQSDFLGTIIKVDNNNVTGLAFYIMIILQFMLIIGLLLAAKKLAKDLSGSFGAQATAVIGGAIGLAGGAALGIAAGGASRFLSGTRGAAAADWLRKNDAMKKAAAGDLTDLKASGKYDHLSDKQMQRMAEKKVKSMQSRSTSSYDIRNTAGANMLSGATGMNMNVLGGVPGFKGLSTEATAGGQAGRIERRSADRIAFIDSLGIAKKTEEKADHDIEAEKANLAPLTAVQKTKQQDKEDAERAIKKFKDANPVDPKTGKAPPLPTSYSKALDDAITDLRAAEKDVTDKNKDIETLEKTKANAKNDTYKKYAAFMSQSDAALNARALRMNFGRDNIGNILRQAFNGGLVGGLVPSYGAGGPAGMIVGAINGLTNGGVLDKINQGLKSVGRGIDKAHEGIFKTKTDLSGDRYKIDVAANIENKHYHETKYTSGYHAPSGGGLAGLIKSLGAHAPSGGGGAKKDDHGGGGHGGH